jgi:hypothetical protein
MSAAKRARTAAVEPEDVEEVIQGHSKWPLVPFGHSLSTDDKWHIPSGVVTDGIYPYLCAVDAMTMQYAFGVLDSNVPSSVYKAWMQRDIPRWRAEFLEPALVPSHYRYYMRVDVAYFTRHSDHIQSMERHTNGTMVAFGVNTPFIWEFLRTVCAVTYCDSPILLVHAGVPGHTIEYTCSKALCTSTGGRFGMTHTHHESIMCMDASILIQMERHLKASTAKPYVGFFMDGSTVMLSVLHIIEYLQEGQLPLHVHTLRKYRFIKRWCNDVRGARHEYITAHPIAEPIHPEDVALGLEHVHCP